MAEESRETDDIDNPEMKGAEDSKLFLKYIMSFFERKIKDDQNPDDTKMKEDQTSDATKGKTPKTKRVSIVLTILTSFFNMLTYASVQLGVVKEQDLENFSQFFYTIDLQCPLETVIWFLNLLHEMPLTHLDVFNTAVNLGAQKISSYFNLTSKLYSVLVATFLFTSLLFLCKKVWSVFCAKLTNADFLGPVKFFTDFRKTSMFWSFAASIALALWMEIKKTLDVLDPNNILTTNAKTPWLCVFMTQENSASDSLLVITTIFAAYVMTWKEPVLQFHQQLLVMFRCKCLKKLFIHCLARNFDQWSCVALGVVFIYWLAVFIALLKGEWKGTKIQNWILSLIPCFVSLKFGIMLFCVTGMFGLVQAIMSITSVEKAGNNKYQRVLFYLWLTEALLSLRPV